MNYLGHLPAGDSLFGYLKYDIMPQLGVPSCEKMTFRVFGLPGSNEVYLYEEKYSGQRMVGKFFLSAFERNHEIAGRRMNREYDHLATMRSFGFDGSPHYVARPLGRNSTLNCLLVTEYCYGELMSGIFSRSIRGRDGGLLYGKLTALAYFLARFHNNSANGHTVNFHQGCDYVDSLLGFLRGCGLSEGEAGEFYFLRDRWREQPKMWEDRQVLAHGDATPENFMFGDGLHVISFDLERLRRADRVYDVGRIAADLVHFFLLENGNKYAAEPFIGHFLWEYACHFPDREAAFRSIVRRVPFYMGITFLRNARNAWLSWEHRRKLVREARHCLRSFGG